MRQKRASGLAITVIRFCGLALAGLAAASGVRGQAAAQVAVLPDERFGAVDAHQDPNAAAESRVGWQRVTFDWSQLEPGPNTGLVNAGLEEQWFSDARSEGRQVVGMIVNTPAWASEGRANIGVPSGLYLPPSDPGNLWARFVRSLVGTYARRGVNQWIIWDNPNIPSGVYGHGWEGSIEDYYQMLKVAYLVAHEVNPEARIYLAGYSQAYDAQWLGRLMEVIAKDPTAPDNDYYFDAATLHLYYDTEQVAVVVANAFLVMQQNGITKDIWLGEIEAYPPDIALEEYPTVTPEQDAAFIIQATAMGLAAGAQRVSVARFVDTQTSDGLLLPGLLDPAGGPRPAYTAFRVITQYFAGAQAASRTKLDLAEHVRIRQADRLTHVAWARTAQPVMLSFPATAQTAVLIDQAGNTQTVQASEDGRFSIRLEAANCNGSGGTCPIGGPAKLLVESGFDPFVVPTPPGAVRVEPAPTLSPEQMTPTATASPTPAPTPSPAPTEAMPTQLPPAQEVAQEPTESLPPTTAPTLAPAPPAPQGGGPAGVLPIALMGIGALVILGGVGFWLWDRAARRESDSQGPDDITPET